jgi:formate-dependent nitrite reductase membrane component NrfD
MGQTTWGWLVIIYLFLGGLGAGAFLTAAFFELSGWRYKREFCPVTLTGATISAPAVAIGSALLILDLGVAKGEPWRILYMFTQFDSVMTWGIWILSLFIPIGLIYGFLELIEVEPFLKGLVWARAPWLLPRVRKYRRRVAAVGSFFAVGTAIYTGVLISAVGPAVPLWSQPILPFLPIPLMPLLFLVSAVSSGLALTFDLAATIARPHIHDDVRPMPLIHIILIGLENMLIGLLFITALSSGGAAAESARWAMYGPLRTIFWIGIVLIGLVVPFAVHAYALGTRKHSLAMGLGSGVGIVIAGLFLRYLIITAGIPAYL